MISARPLQLSRKTDVWKKLRFPLYTETGFLSVKRLMNTSRVLRTRRIRRKRRHSRAGFSLIEILVVVALVAMLVSVVVFNVDTIFGANKENIASTFVRSSMKVPLTQYQFHMGSYPSTEEGLKALVQPPAGKEAKWKGPYVEELPKDPWGNDYQYRFPGTKHSRGYDLWSYGPDGVESGDDIGNWSTP